MDHSFAQRLVSEGKELEQRLIAFRRELHRYPELSSMESRTAERVVKAMEGLGYDVKQGVGGHGIVAELTGGMAGETIALRADMDALPIDEDTGLDFASEAPGVMHACGHDLHTAILLGAAELLSRHRVRIRGNVRLIFQPAEETLAGALAMLAEGALDGVAEIYGLHNQPLLETGKIAVKSGALMAAADRLEIKVTGQGGHGAMPDRCKDPILASAALLMGIQTAVSRELPPGEPRVVSFGTIHAGTTNNVIPDVVELTGTVRSLSPETRDRLEALIYRQAEYVTAAYRTKAEVNYIRQAPPLFNDAACTDRVRRTAAAMIGAERCMEAEAMMGAEDFAYYAERLPGGYFWLGSGYADRKGEVHGLHSARYDPNEDSIALGASLLAGIVLDRIGY